MPFLELFGPLSEFYGIVLRFWWVWSVPLSVSVFITVWLSYKQNLYKLNIKWSLLELKIPREVDKSPKAMEQFLTALHTLSNQAGDFLDKYQNGEVSKWFSLEVVSLEGDIHLFIRLPEEHKRIVIANLYANYPMIDIEEVEEDYINSFPDTLDNLYHNKFDLWGAEMKLRKEDPLPIRSYLEFENLEDAFALDPIAGLLEVFARCTAGENLMMQILIRPADDKWKERGEKFVEELREKGTVVTKGSDGSEKKERSQKTPGETDLIKAVENNISKPGFETTIRYIYVAKKTIMNKDFARRSVMASLNQYSSQNLNSFGRNFKTSTDTKWTYFPYFFTKKRVETRKRRMLYNYRKRNMPQESGVSRFISSSPLHFDFTPELFVLNTEELATLYHPPTRIVMTSQLIDRVPSKKVAPPTGLNMYQKEKE
ncbi:MAG: hypothetical protein O2794_03090 [bacterium]|nr:hypothetical protein [bacterium]